jgi:hypothetical protein
MTRLALVFWVTACSSHATTTTPDAPGPTCASQAEAGCHALTGCQLTGSSCVPGPNCPPDQSPPVCIDTLQPTMSSGPACNTLSPDDCRHRDDCDVLHLLQQDGTTTDECMPQS